MTEQKLTYPDVLPLLRLFANDETNAVGGNLHIFLGDGNIGNDHITFCLKKCIETGDLLGEAICRITLRMSYTQRKKMYRDFPYAPQTIEAISTYNITKVGKSLCAVDGLDSIRTLDGTVIRISPIVD
jgi:hypothetical protein